MITVKIQGGLGNQLFQYAFGRALKQKGKEVIFNKSFYEEAHAYTKRQFLLDKFVLNKDAVFESVPTRQNFFIKVWNRIDADRKNRFIPSLFSRDNFLADGWYTSEKYFRNIRSELIGEIKLKEERDLYKKFKQMICEAHKPLIIHARRGDYLTSTGYVILDNEYYTRALKEFDSDCEVFGFSDDPEWLKGVINRPLTMISGQSLEDYEELSLMSHGENFIISNSTFSWWGAWLSQAKNKKVVAPKKWFTFIRWWRANRDIVPEGWIRV